MLVCPRCQFQNDPRNAFCGRCALPLQLHAQAPPPGPPQVPNVPHGPYVPPPAPTKNYARCWSCKSFVSVHAIQCPYCQKRQHRFSLGAVLVTAWMLIIPVWTCALGIEPTSFGMGVYFVGLIGLFAWAVYDTGKRERY